MPHTPGPWGYSWSEDELEIYDAGVGADGSLYPGCKELYVYQTGGSLIIREADARLIAAAPELLEAAKKALNFIANTESELGIELDCGDSLRSAIAKAEAV